MARRYGRPLHEMKPDDMTSLGVRITSEMKTRINAEAIHSGRTQSQVAVEMIERAFAYDDWINRLKSAADA